MTDNELNIIKIKAEIFDLQVELGTAKKKIEDKMRQLTVLTKKNGLPQSRILSSNDPKGALSTNS